MFKGRQPGEGGREDGGDGLDQGARAYRKPRWTRGRWRSKAWPGTEALSIGHFHGGAGDTSAEDLAGDQDAEVQAMANYTHAKIFFDSAWGALWR